MSETNSERKNESAEQDVGFCPLSLVFVIFGALCTIGGFVCALILTDSYNYNYGMIALLFFGGILTGMYHFALAVIVDACQKYRNGRSWDRSFHTSKIGCFIMVISLTSSTFLSSCSSKNNDVVLVESYMRSIDDRINEIDAVLVSDKFIADPDSSSVTEYVLQIKDTTMYGMEQKLWLLMGNEIYFGALNSGIIKEKQIDNIKRVSEQYKQLSIQPSSYAFFSLVQFTDKYGTKHTSPLAFLLNKNDSIIRCKEVELCPSFINLFDEDEIDRLTEISIR